MGGMTEERARGGMRVSDQGFAELTSLVAGSAESYADGRVVALLEGGYDPAALACSVSAFC